MLPIFCIFHFLSRFVKLICIYESHVDAIYTEFLPGAASESDSISENIIIDYNEEEKIVGIEILNILRINCCNLPRKAPSLLMFFACPTRPAACGIFGICRFISGFSGLGFPEDRFAGLKPIWRSI